MTDEKLEPVQSLRLIEQMIEQAKGRFSENGHLYLLWGWVIFGCSLFHFIAIEWQLLPHPEMVWMATWLAFIYQAIYLYRHRHTRRVRTYADTLIGAVWLVFVGCGFITGFVVSSKGGWETVYPLILMLYGMPTILSGVILRFRPLIIGGLICWILCLTAVYLPLKYNLVLVSLAVVAAWIIPGYMMQVRFKKENP